MTQMDAESTAHGYLERAGRAETASYALRADEALWLLSYWTGVGSTALSLLKSLQASLPRDETSEVVTELKDTLTNLIIMQTRLSDRDEQLASLLQRAFENDTLTEVSVDQDTIAAWVEEVSKAADHFTAGADKR